MLLTYIFQNSFVTQTRINFLNCILRCDPNFLSLFPVNPYNLIAGDRRWSSSISQLVTCLSGRRVYVRVFTLPSSHLRPSATYIFCFFVKLMRHCCLRYASSAMGTSEETFIRTFRVTNVTVLQELPGHFKGTNCYCNSL